MYARALSRRQVIVVHDADRRAARLYSVNSTPRAVLVRSGRIEVSELVNTDTQLARIVRPPPEGRETALAHPGPIQGGW
jgi:hypothetical protein